MEHLDNIIDNRGGYHSQRAIQAASEFQDFLY